MAMQGEQVLADNRLVATGEVVQSGLSEKQKSDESYQSAVSGNSTGTPSTRDSRSVTPDSVPSETTVSTTPQITEDSGFDPRNTNLDYFHAEARFDQLISQGQFTKVKGLSDCCRSDGKVELHSWKKVGCGDLSVVVKRVVISRVGANVGKEANERIVYRGHCQRHAEDCLNEVGVFCYLAQQRDLPQYVLKMHAAFQASGDVWLVLQHANDGDLFAVAQKLKREGSSLSPSQLMTWTWQLLQAVRYLHKHAIGHRDISMENVLLCNGSVRLMDFGQSVRTHSAGGALLRYFNALGKPYYRPPECHCPMQNSVEVYVPASARAGEVAFVRTATGDTLCEVLLPSGAVAGQICAAEPWGYAAAPVDIFAVGVCIFIMATGMPPWRNANLSDPHFAWVHQAGIIQLLKAWKKVMPASSDVLMAAMMQSEPAKRPSAEQCCSHSWFDELSGVAVPVHDLASPESVHAEAQPEIPGMAFSEFGMAGDPYTQEAVARSVAAPSMDMSCATAYQYGGILAGDFYSMPEDTLCRSAGVAAPEELTLQRFSAGDVPPKVPTSESFAFEPTTFYVSGKKPAQLGTHLLDFLTLAAGAVVKKVGIKKFTIKAEVDGEDGGCTLKVRIYDQGEGKHAVEFQRREGDSTTFHKVFDQVSAHFVTPVEPSKSIEVKDITADHGKKGEVVDESCQAIDLTSCPSAQAFATCNSLPSKPCGHRQPGTRAGSVPASTNRADVPARKFKVASAETLECMASERAANPAGSALNAVRLRSKSTLRRPSKTTGQTSVQFNATF